MTLNLVETAEVADEQVVFAEHQVRVMILAEVALTVLLVEDEVVEQEVEIVPKQKLGVRDALLPHRHHRGPILEVQGPQEKDAQVMRVGHRSS